MQEQDFATVAIGELSTEVMVRWMKDGMDKPQEKVVELPISFGRGDENAVVLVSKQVSRHHAMIEWRDNQMVLKDLGSTNGVFVNGERDQEVLIEASDEITMGEYTIKVEMLDYDKTQVVADRRHGQNGSQNGSQNGDLNGYDRSKEKEDDSTMLPFCLHTDRLQPVPTLTAEGLAPLPAMFEQPVVSWRELEVAKMPMRETTYLTIGGGMGSFSWVDGLVIGGVDPSQIVALGFKPNKPYGRYLQLCQNSQIPGHERLRSNSDSCPDNIWGWPGYAVREMWGSFKQSDFRQVARVGWQIFNEPFTESYTPRSKDVFDSIDREAARIGWDQIWREGRVEAIRKTDDERYVIMYSLPQEGGEATRMLMVTKYLHIAVGYPGVRFLPDLLEYRQRTGDYKSVINAYERHEHVYEHLIKHGGTVLIRGRGIVASRILQKLNEIRAKRKLEKRAPDIRILHLMRSPKPAGQRFGRAKRVVENHWEFQPFNWPKAAWGGTTRVWLERASDPERDELLTLWGGTTTADRQDWRDMIESGRQEGWYDAQFGRVERVERDAERGKVTTIIRSQNIAKEQKLHADFIIDATGLDAALDRNPLLKDLRQMYHLERNPKGRLKTSNDFEIEGLRNGTGRTYTAGVMALGSAYAPVDSFLGLQYAALCALDSLNQQRAPGLKKLNGIRSLAQWLRWARGVKP
ncbi:MAG: FHA domain-containing protein [Ardenticatenaceae bacterium]